MSELNVSFRPELRRPVLVAAFRGWNDGGQGATLAAGYLAKQWDAQQFAEIEPETFYDFQATRPQVTLEDGMTRKLEWPENSFFHAEIPGTEPRRGDPARHRAEPALEDVLGARARPRAATSASSASSRSARCSPTCRTRARRR